MVSKVAFEKWLDGVAPGESINKLAEKSGVPSGTISVQRARDNIAALTILKIAQAYDLNPFKELSGFEGYESLKSDDVDRKDLLCVAMVINVFTAFLKQDKKDPSEEYYLPVKQVSKDAFTRWLNFHAEDINRKDLAEKVGIDGANFSRQIRNHSMSFDNCVKLAQVLDADARVPLFCCGHVQLSDITEMSLREVLESVPYLWLKQEIHRSKKFLFEEIEDYGIE